MTAGFLGVEVVVGVFSKSLALLSDAAHMLTDVAALTLALLAQRLADRPREGRWTYGYRRAETLAALVNGLALGLSALLILREGIERWSRPSEVRGLPMLVVAVAGLVVNLVAAKLLSMGEGKKNANVKAALAHVLSDALGSGAAIVAGAVVLGTGYARADTIASVLIGVLVLASARKVVVASSRVLMEAAPEGLAATVDEVVRGVPGVSELHDLHVWEISEGEPLVTVHVVLAEGAHGVEVVTLVRRALELELGIRHATVQPEARAHGALLSASRLTRRALPSGQGADEGGKAEKR